MVIVGGGPTGVELAGSFAELARTVLKRDFRHIDPAQARIILIEAAPTILSHLPSDLSESATRQLQKLGVQVRTSTRVKAIREKKSSWKVVRSCVLKHSLGRGSSASALTKKLGVELDRAVESK